MEDESMIEQAPPRCCPTPAIELDTAVSDRAWVCRNCGHSAATAGEWGGLDRPLQITTHWTDAAEQPEMGSLR